MASSTITFRRRDLVHAIARAVGVPAPSVALGSTVVTTFLDHVLSARGGDRSSLNNAYEKLHWLLDSVGETYDPTCDSSEHRGETGGGTITNTGFRKLLRGLTQVPYCFILSIADHPVSAEYHDVPGETYGFDDDVSGRRALLEAPAGSRVVFYRTRKASQRPRQAVIADAVVESVARVDSRYEASLANYRVFQSPVLSGSLEIAGWNRQHGIAEINYEAFSAIVAAGTGDPTPRVLVSVTEPDIPVDHVGDALRVDGPFARETEAIDVGDPVTDVPAAVQPELPSLAAVDDPGGDDDLAPHGRQRSRSQDRFAEKRAVHITKVLLGNSGWTFKRSRELDGVGYDLDFERDGRPLHVEVKGIQGPRLAFNLTGSEWTRAIADEAFVVMAVTNVTDPHRVRAHVVRRDRILRAPKRLISLRLFVNENIEGA